MATNTTYSGYGPNYNFPGTDTQAGNTDWINGTNSWDWNMFSNTMAASTPGIISAIGGLFGAGGGSTLQVTPTNPNNNPNNFTAPKEEPNYLLWGGIAFGAILLIVLIIISLKK